MPRIGSILNPPLAAIERKIINLECDRTVIIDRRNELKNSIDSIDAEIAGFRQAHKILLEESNKI